MKKIRLIQLLFLSLFLIGTYLPTQAQKIDTISVYSTSMKKQIKNIIILPASYTQNTQKKYPVAYLLHGYGGCYDTWATYTKPDLAQMASNFDMITEMFRSLSYGEYPIETARVRPPDDNVNTPQDSMFWLQLFFIWLIPLSILAWCIMFLIGRKRK